MRERRRKFTPEFKDEAVKMVIESSRSVAEVAREIQVNEGTLGNWVHKYRLDHAGEEPPLSISDRARLRELERENRELKMKAEFLGKAAGRLQGGASRRRPPLLRRQFASSRTVSRRSCRASAPAERSFGGSSFLSVVGRCRTRSSAWAW
jgi:transposase